MEVEDTPLVETRGRGLGEEFDLETDGKGGLATRDCSERELLEVLLLTVARNGVLLMRAAKVEPLPLPDLRLRRLDVDVEEDVDWLFSGPSGSDTSGNELPSGLVTSTVPFVASEESELSVCRAIDGCGE